MEVYKVVEKKTRHCSNWALFKVQPGSRWNYPVWQKFRRKHIGYFPRYLKGNIIKAVKGSLGILTFEWKWHAENFIAQNASANLIIIRVKGIGDYHKVTWLKGNCGGRPSNILYYDQEMSAPYGTCGFQAVEVLE